MRWPASWYLAAVVLWVLFVVGGPVQAGQFLGEGLRAAAAGFAVALSGSPP